MVPSDGQRYSGPTFRFAAVAVAYVVAILQFLYSINLLAASVKLYGGVLAYGALMAIVALCVALLAFTLGIPAFYRQGERRGTFGARFFLVCSVQGFLFPALRALRFRAVYLLRPNLWDYVVGGAGLAVFAAGAILARRSFVRARRSRGAPGATGSHP